MSTALPASDFSVGVLVDANGERGTVVDPASARIDEELLSEHYFPTGYVVVATEDGHMFVRPEAVRLIAA